MSADHSNPFEAMMKLGQEWASTMGTAWANFSPKAWEDMMPTMPKELMETMIGKTFNPEGLDAKTRLLLTLAGLTITGASAESQIRMSVRHALEAGATHQEIAETLAVAGIFGGAPAMSKAMSLAAEVLAPKEDDKEGDA
jgi:4-carboxymuconolactone decarboxylase